MSKLTHIHDPFPLKHNLYLATGLLRSSRRHAAKVDGKDDGSGRQDLSKCTWHRAALNTAPKPHGGYHALTNLQNRHDMLVPHAVWRCGVRNLRIALHGVRGINTSIPPQILPSFQIIDDFEKHCVRKHRVIGPAPESSISAKTAEFPTVGSYLICASSLYTASRLFIFLASLRVLVSMSWRRQMLGAQMTCRRMLTRLRGLLSPPKLRQPV